MGLASGLCIVESVARVSAEAKAQHYIPKFYLKGFTDEHGKLWVREKFEPIRASKPKLEARRPDYYTHAEQGERDETAENVLKEAESRAADCLQTGEPAVQTDAGERWARGHLYCLHVRQSPELTRES